MATIANQYDPNNPNANANTGGGGTVMPSSSGGSASVAAGSGSGGTSSPSSGAAPYQPPNVSQYLAANQGAGQQLTQGITGNVQNQANKLQNQVNTSQNQQSSQYQPLSENLGSKAQSTIQTAFQNPQDLLNAYNSAKTNSSNQPLSSDQQQNADQYNQFQQLNSGGYNQAIQNYGNQGQQSQNQLQGQLGALTQQTGSAANEMGRNQLLQNAVGKGGNYNQGEQTLDSLFLQGQPGQRNSNGLSNLQQLQQNLGGIGKQATQQVNDFGTDTQNKLAALQGMSAQDQASIKNLFLNGNQNGQGLNQIGQNVQSEYDTAKQNANDVNTGFQQAFQNNQYTPEQLAALGLQQGQQTWGLKGSDLQNASGYQANPLADFSQGGAAMTASPEEFARYNALNQLAGGPNGLQNNVFGSATQAGGYNPYTLTGGTQGASDAINKQAQLYGVTKVNDLIDQMKSAGYFRGASEGGGMRAADPYASNRVAMGTALAGLEGNKQADPNSYYNDVMKAINNSWGGTGVDVYGQAPILNQLKGYGNTLSGVQNQRLNMTDPGDPSQQLPTDPNTGAIDWSKVNAPKGK